ncbi:C-X-C chemokine receptor type 2 [Hoplias malabaricus]|uniref:C-X-C chemokine receptor type 2 n=1 Tax=Hoplias malabaricus TaxID=27720 RepID=UPI003461E7E2
MAALGWIESIIRAIMCLSGIIGNNWLGFCSLPKSRSQIRINDVLFVNLALSNLITNYMVDLPEILDFTSNFVEGKKYCGTFNFCSNLSETSSIFTTLFITVFWHQKLVGSLKHGGAPVPMDNIRLVAALLVGNWFASVVFSLPHLFFVPVSTGNVSSRECVGVFPSHKTKNIYDTLYLIMANLAPIIGIVFASIQIAVTLLQNHGRIKNKNRVGALHSPPEDQRRAGGGDVKMNKFSSSSGNQVRAAKSVLAVAAVFLSCWLIHILLTITSTISESTVLVEMTSYVGALYTCIIPYIYLHGLKKLNCSSRD